MEKVSSLNCEQNTGWFTGLYKKLVFKAFSSIETGQITVIDEDLQLVFGDASSDLKVTVTIHDKAMYLSLIHI